MILEVRRWKSDALQLVFMAAAIWGVGFARAALGPLQEAMRAGLALSDQQVAWLQGPTVALPMALGAIPLGLLANHYPRARLLALAVAGALTATALSVFATKLPVLFASRSLIGFAIAAVSVAAYSMVADLYQPAQRGRATMIVAIGEVGGAPAAFALGGALLAIGPAASPLALEPWRGALLWMTVLLLPVLLLMLWVREPSRTQVQVRNPSLHEVWHELWAYRRVLGPLMLGRMMMWIADGAVLVWAAPSFARRFQLPPDKIGAIIGAAMLVSGLLGPLLGGPLADLCQRTGGPRRTVTALIGLAVLSVPTALFAIAPDATTAGVLLAVFLTLGYTLGTAALTLGTIVVPGELRGVYLALSVTIGALFFVGVAPLVISSVANALGGEAMVAKALALSCAISSLLGAGILIATRRFFPKECCQ